MSFELAKTAQQTKMNPGMRSRSSCKAVYNALAHFADDDMRLAYPCVATLIEYTELSKKAITSALKELEDFGYISDTDMRAGRTKQVKVFNLRFPNQDNLKERLIDTSLPPEQDHIDASSPSEDGSIDSPSENERGSDCSLKGVGLSQKGGTILPTIKSVNKSRINKQSWSDHFESQADFIEWNGLAGYYKTISAQYLTHPRPSLQLLLVDTKNKMDRLKKPQLKIVRSA